MARGHSACAVVPEQQTKDPAGEPCCACVVAVKRHFATGLVLLLWVAAVVSLPCCTEGVKVAKWTTVSSTTIHTSSPSGVDGASASGARGRFTRTTHSVGVTHTFAPPAASESGPVSDAELDASLAALYDRIRNQQAAGSGDGGSAQPPELGAADVRVIGDVVAASAQLRSSLAQCSQGHAACKSREASAARETMETAAQLRVCEETVKTEQAATQHAQLDASSSARQLRKCEAAAASTAIVDMGDRSAEREAAFKLELAEQSQRVQDLSWQLEVSNKQLKYLHAKHCFGLSFTLLVGVLIGASWRYWLVRFLWRMLYMVLRVVFKLTAYTFYCISAVVTLFLSALGLYKCEKGSDGECCTMEAPNSCKLVQAARALDEMASQPLPYNDYVPSKHEPGTPMIVDAGIGVHQRSSATS